MTIATVPRAVDPATGWTISPIVAASLCIKPRGLLTPHQAAKVDALKNASADFTAMTALVGYLTDNCCAKLSHPSRDVNAGLPLSST